MAHFLTDRQKKLVQQLLEDRTLHPELAMLRAGYSAEMSRRKWQETIAHPRVAKLLREQGWIVPSDFTLPPRETREQIALARELADTPQTAEPVKPVKPVVGPLEPSSTIPFEKNVKKFTKEKAFEEAGQVLEVALAERSMSTVASLVTHRAKLTGLLIEKLELAIPKLTEYYTRLRSGWNRATMIEDTPSEIIDAQVVEPEKPRTEMQRQIAAAREKVWKDIDEADRRADRAMIPAPKPKPEPAKPEPVQSEQNFDRDKSNFFHEQATKERRTRQAQGTDYDLFNR
jgi:hypothetical protein